MQSTRSGPVPAYIGADLTDRYSRDCRAIDVCGLMPDGHNGLRADFWRWSWDPAPQSLDVAVIAQELRGARVSMLDGPQALAAPGTALRVCERRSAAAGKTPDRRPDLAKPFAGFICSSLELFAALRGAGLAISPPAFVGGVSEVYPAHIWTILGGGRPLPQKSTGSGRLARKLILECLGVSGLPALPTHDENDACIAALIAAAADSQVAEVSVAHIGAQLSVDPTGELREGPMVVPRICGAIADRIGHALCGVVEPERPARPLNEPSSGPFEPTAEELLSALVAKAAAGAPHVCTYAWAYRHLFKGPYTKFSQAYARKVIDVARRTQPRQVPGLGFVRLDAFIVSKSDRRPSDGYWTNAQHGREDWERALGQATVLD